jgi:hypothetical protein
MTDKQLDKALRRIVRSATLEPKNKAVRKATAKRIINETPAEERRATKRFKRSLKKKSVTWAEIYASACAPDPKRSAAARKAWKTRRAQAEQS